MELGKLLIVDDSKLYRKFLTVLLRPYASSVTTAASVSEAIAAIDSEPGLDVVVCDVVLGDGDGFEILEHAASLPGAPQVLMVTGYRDPSGLERAALLGAVGYLAKPTRLRSIADALRAPIARYPTNRRVRCSGVAYLLDATPPHPEQMAWDLYNLCNDGAFIETKGPLPIGDELYLRLHIAGRQAHVRARVVRVQEPSWMDVGGVGVTFIDPSAESRAVIDAAIQGAELEADAVS